MGISNLLPLLEKSTRPCHISEFRGHTVAVDSYCWLHKGARGCALQLAKGEATNTYVTFCLKYVYMLLSYNIKPIMVFDGRRLPAKIKTEEKRRALKKQARKQGIELLRLGKVDEANKFFKQCIDITPEMALALIKECRKINVDCIVAPYESDAQLAFFSIKGIAECIISEDSDLLLFGCQKVLYKMDLTGSGQLVDADKIYLSLKIRPDQYTFNKFRHMCILSGCDYVDSLPGVGLKKAMKFVTMTVEENPVVFLDRIPRYLNMRQLSITGAYKKDFLVADATFKHQTVYDPFNRKLVPLNPIQTDIMFCKNAGDLFDSQQAFQLALGNLNPLTMKKIDDWQPDGSIPAPHSIWLEYNVPSPLKTVKNNNIMEPTAKKPRTFNRQEIEKINLQHDQQFEKELEFYKKKVPVETESEFPTDAPSEEDTSPVLRTYLSNPFIKKRISKFNITTVNSEQKVIRSRFFLIPTLESCKEEAESEENKTETSGINKPPEQYVDTTILSKGVEKPILFSPDISALSGIENLSLHVPKENMELPQTSDTDNLPLPSNEDMAELPLIECECILEVDDVEIEIPPDPPKLTSVENLLEEPLAKKRKVEQPEVKKQKKQITIIDMFKKMYPQ
ncbi:exonuclease 1, partial [Asbolus verrucosus]